MSASYSVKVLFILKLMNAAFISHIVPFALGLLSSWDVSTVFATCKRCHSV